MFKYIFIFIIITSYFQRHNFVYAHPGGLDSNGGHTCRSNCEQYGLTTGQYHYHTTSPTPSPTSEIQPSPTPQTTYSTPSISSVGQIILSEFMPNPKEDNEWAEIYNSGSNTVDISGYKIDDIEGASSPFTIPDGIVIYPLQYLYFSFSSKLNNSGDSIRFINNQGQVVEEFNYNQSTQAIAFAKDAQGVWKQTSTPTQGQPNIITIPAASESQNQTKSNSQTGPQTSVGSSQITPSSTKSTYSKSVRPQVLSESTKEAQVGNLTATQSSSTISSSPDLSDNPNRGVLPYILLITGGSFIFGLGLYRYYKLKK